MRNAMALGTLELRLAFTGFGSSRLGIASQNSADSHLGAFPFQVRVVSSFCSMSILINIL